MPKYLGWGAIGGLGEERYACSVNGNDYRITRLKDAWSLSTWSDSGRFWYFLGEYASPDEATRRVNLIENYIGIE